MNSAEKRILEEEKKIEKDEKRILVEENLIASVIQSENFQGILENGKAISRLDKTRRFLVRRIAKHKFVFTLIVSLGIVLVWRGIWDVSEKLPFLSDSFVALIVGLTILWLIEKYTSLE